MPTDKFRKEIILTKDERELITKRMKEAGMNNMSAYMRRMALYGYVIYLDMREVKEILRLMKISSNNLNQYAKKANETGSIYKEDIEDLQRSHKELLYLLGDILEQLEKID